MVMTGTRTYTQTRLLKCFQCKQTEKENSYVNLALSQIE